MKKMKKLQIIIAAMLLTLSGCEKKEFKVMNQTVRAVAGEWMIDDFFVADANAPKNVVDLIKLPVKGKLAFSYCGVGESGSLEGCNAYYAPEDTTKALHFQYGTEPKNRFLSFRMGYPGDEKLKRALEGDWEITVAGNRMVAVKNRGYDTVTGGLILRFTADKKR